MRFLPLYALLLCSCVHAPVVRRDADGGITASMGGVFMARRKNVLAEITTKEGDRIRYQTEEESGEDVPKSLISAYAAKWLAAIQGDVTKHKDSVDSQTTLGLGAQGVQKEGIKAGVQTEAIKGGVTELPQ